MHVTEHNNSSNQCEIFKSKKRVRPKMMTVATTILGLMPLMWSMGAGADMVKRIAAPMVGGLVTSTVLTLIIIPVVYSFWKVRELPDKANNKGGR
ncbi:MAG: efflux RND transporter permease subunit [Candidatus Dadabacteria bacterium]|nr:efflux RND transporter permease subunit [Candidatus Dadabacteria bacterium]